MSKHTPGPWTTNYRSGWRVIHSHKTDSILTVAELYGEDSEANARLIAAAPDMLEALKAAQPHLYMASNSIKKQVHAAIAKAEGTS